jgi:hypothetical protein
MDDKRLRELVAQLIQIAVQAGACRSFNEFEDLKTLQNLLPILKLDDPRK